jgi:hypothetical protein
VKRLALALAALLAWSAGAVCQAAPLPEPVDLFQYSKAPSRAYGFPSFRFWGWSKDGKIAYSIESEVEGRGGSRFEYVVLDLVSDEVLWSYPDDSETWDAYDEAVDGSFAQYSYKHAAGILGEALEAYEIIVAPAAFSAFPIKSAGRTYEVSMKVEKERRASPEDAIASYSVAIARDDGKAKTVTASSEVKALAVYACGYLPSPFESRVAIAIAEERFVFEGTELFYSFAGCNLKVGFK